MKTEVKLSGGKIVVKVKIPAYKSGGKKKRFYTQDARELAQKAYPNEKILGVEKNVTLANYENNCEGQWVFKVEKKAPKKRSSSLKKEEAKIEKPKKATNTTRKAKKEKESKDS